MTTIECPVCGESLADGNEDECPACNATLTALEQDRDYQGERWTCLPAREDDDDI